MLIICGAIAIMILMVIYPFLPGEYDPFAMPASTAIQMLGGAGLLLVPVGVLWLVREIRIYKQRNKNPIINQEHYFAEISLIVGSIAALLANLIMFAVNSILLGILFLVLSLATILSLKLRLKQWKAAGANTFNPTPLYIIIIPISVTFLSLRLAEPITNMSRDNAIANSEEFINAIEQSYALRGQYPTSMQGLWPDYKALVVGVAGYSYAPQGAGYNLSFEQPRFLFDDFGTQEVVMYNKLDEHMMLSHASWHLTRSPESIVAIQGWYEARDTKIKHWKIFLFD